MAMGNGQWLNSSFWERKKNIYFLFAKILFFTNTIVCMGIFAYVTESAITHSRNEANTYDGDEHNGITFY